MQNGDVLLATPTGSPVGTGAHLVSTTRIDLSTGVVQVHWTRDTAPASWYRVVFAMTASDNERFGFTVTDQELGVFSGAPEDPGVVPVPTQDQNDDPHMRMFVDGDGMVMQTSQDGEAWFPVTTFSLDGISPNGMYLDISVTPVEPSNVELDLTVHEVLGTD